MHEVHRRIGFKGGVCNSRVSQDTTLEREVHEHTLKILQSYGLQISPSIEYNTHVKKNTLQHTFLISQPKLYYRILYMATITLHGTFTRQRSVFSDRLWSQKSAQQWQGKQ